MSRGIWALAAAFIAAPTIAADQPQYAPPPAWVKPIAIPGSGVAVDASSVQILLEDQQWRFGDDGDAFYSEVAVKILAPQGLTGFANLPMNWRPDTETLVIHRLQILRGGKAIDLLAGGKAVTVLRRETNLERAMLNGELTATVQPEGLQVGDVIDWAYTLERRDPVLQGRSESWASVRYDGAAGRFYLRALWPKDKPMRWREGAGLPPLVVADAADGGGELLLDETDAMAPKLPNEAPARYADIGSVDVSQFRSWAEVSALMAPLYAKASTLGAASPLHVEAAAIRKASNDPKTRAEAALRLVEDQIHYVFLGMNQGGYVPADADVTWSRRFGDCKGKTVLLLALLHDLGIQAEPALVSTGFGDGLDQRLPRLDGFDHVMVRAIIKGKVYWLDGTRIGDRDLDDIPVPDVRWVLPVRPAGAVLEFVSPKLFETPQFEGLLRLDATAGYDAPAPAHAEQVYHGDAATAWHVVLDQLGKADADRGLKAHWREAYPWITVQGVAYNYDDQRHLMQLTMDGSATMDWSANGASRELSIGDSNLGFETSFDRDPGPGADAPFSLAYPQFDRRTVVIRLPSHGLGFRLAGGADVDEDLAGRHYLRRSRLEDGVVTMVAENRHMVSEIPQADARAAAQALRDLADFDVVVRGPAVLAAGDDEADAGPTAEPATAAGFSARGASELNHQRYQPAIADFTAAARLDPNDGKPLYDRGVAYLGAGQAELARRDFDQALRLNPKDGLAYRARGELYLSLGQIDRAQADFADAEKLAPNDISLLTRIAIAFDNAGRYDEAVRRLGLLVARVTDKPRLEALLNQRCWVRAEWGRELDQALSDCNAALALAPANPEVLDSRGFLNLRSKRYDQAVSDYDEALSLAPRLATSLYGRGLAELAQGQTAQAQADFAAAQEAAPDVSGRFVRYGFPAPAGAGR